MVKIYGISLMYIIFQKFYCFFMLKIIFYYEMRVLECYFMNYIFVFSFLDFLVIFQYLSFFVEKLQNLNYKLVVIILDVEVSLDVIKYV